MRLWRRTVLRAQTCPNPLPVSSLAVPRRAPAVITLIVGDLGLALAVAGMLRQNERREFQETVRQIANARVEALRGQMMRSMEVLRAIASLYCSSGRGQPRGIPGICERGADPSAGVAGSFLESPRARGEDRDCVGGAGASGRISGFPFYTEEKEGGVMTGACSIGRGSKLSPGYFVDDRSGIMRPRARI